MVDQAQIDGRETCPIYPISDVKFLQRRLARDTPVVETSLELWGHEEVGWFGAFQWLFACRRHVHIVTPAIVLCAVSTLWKRLVAANVSPLARFAALSRLCVALARWATSRTCHSSSQLERLSGGRGAVCSSLAYLESFDILCKNPSTRG
jgi:hypothetical protein